MTISPAKCATCDMLQHAPLACADCHTLLEHVQGADYLELFGLPRTYALDPADLQRRFLAISRNIHPDRFATAEPEMQSLAMRLAASINKAYDTLRDPSSRAEYLLEIAGGRSAADDKRVPQELLGWIMMLREEIEEAKATGDDQALSELRATISSKKDLATARIAELADGRLDGDTARRDALRLELNSIKYLNNLLAQL